MPDRLGAGRANATSHRRERNRQDRIGFLASSLGVKIDVEQPGSRFLLIYVFYLIHQVIYFGIMRGLANEPLTWYWGHQLLGALLDSLIGVVLFICSTASSNESRQAAEKLFSEGVILSEAKDLLSARAESKADPKRKSARPQDDTDASFSAAC